MDVILTKIVQLVNNVLITDVPIRVRLVLADQMLCVVWPTKDLAAHVLMVLFQVQLQEVSKIIL